MICYNCFQEKPEGKVCPFCGYDEENGKKYPLALKAGSILNGRYIVGRVLGQSGFGNICIVQDYNSKERFFAIKGHFPTDFAGWDHWSSFAQIDSCFEENNTAL